MTREEAIQFLDNMKHEEAGRAIGKDGFYAELMGYHVQALNIAIKALRQEPKTGHWIAEENEEMETIGYFCSECDLPMETEDQTRFCPNCGCRMVVPQERSGEE